MLKSGLNPNTWIENIDKILSSGQSIDEMLASFNSALGGTTDEVKIAIAALIGAGQTIQSIAEDQTRAISRAKEVREQQAKWNSMTAAEKVSFMTENQDLFTTNGE